KTKKDGSQSTEKFFNWIKNHKLKVLLVILLFTIIIVPIIINLSFVKNGIILVKWEAKDVLIYYGSVLAFLGTSFLGALTLYLSNKNSSANKKLMEMQYISQNEILIETPQENEASVYLEEQDVSHRGGYSVLQLEADDTNSLWFYSKIDLSSNSNNISFRVKHLQFHAFINPQKIPPNFFRYKNSEEDFSPLYVISENNKYYSRVGIIIYMSEDLYNRVIKQEGLLINGEIEVLTGAEIIRIYQFNIMFINKIIESDYTEISRGFKKTLQYYIRTTEKRD
ncbi:MAG: hypothetical protein KAQ68_10360, partial [Clostridiales bacterium]|nr:hypothetical protein [Clostridiales bacterium]